MIRFWITFKLTFYDDPPAGTLLGIGVTASNEQEAMELVQRHVFAGKSLPIVKEICKDISVANLDVDHVVPNMGDIEKKGIWFPLGYGGFAKG